MIALHSRYMIATCVVVLATILILWHHSEELFGLQMSTNNDEPVPSKKQYTHSLVMASTKAEDTSWVHTELPDLQKFIYVADDPNAPHHPAQNKGHESMMYLTHIVDHYHDLTDVVSFTHAQQMTWHNNDVFGLDLAEHLRRLRLSYVVERAPGGYFNLRCHQESGCPGMKFDERGIFDPALPDRNFLRETWESLHGKAPIPDVIGVMCCAQFAVSREAIHRISLEHWKFYLDWLISIPYPDSISGRVWEFTWHILFTGQAIVCPSTAECYCQGYGLCFEGGEAQIDAWLAMQQMEFLLDLQVQDLHALGQPAEKERDRVSFQLDQKVRRVMNKRKEMAYARGLEIHGRSEL